MLDGAPVAGVSAGTDGVWTTFVAVSDAGAAERSVANGGGTVLAPCVCADPEGARFRLAPAGWRLSAQLVNVAGTWNFSNLHTSRPEEARAFYGVVFGWEPADVGGGAAMWRLPGYGDHLAATVDPDIHVRQAQAPEGFADVVAGLVVAEAAPAWRVTFTVTDRDRSAQLAARLGAEVRSTEESMWTRTALIRDPQGAELTLSQFAPPSDWS
jgi:predicted enzyme related to lactoylglutathione lyase